MLEILTEYQIMHNGAVCGYVIKRDDPRHFWIAKDFEEAAEWVLFKHRIELRQAIDHGIVRRADSAGEASRG